MGEQRVAIVTGGGRGIGAAISRRLAGDGFAVAVNYSASADAAKGVVSDIEAAGGRAAAIRADVSAADQAAELIRETTRTLGAPAVLVNNAGLNIRGSARSMSPADWDKVIAVNLNGPFYCTHAALPAMYQAGWGRVILVGSPSGGRDLMPTTGPYAAAKGGLAQWGAVLAKEVARRGITVNTVVPGFVETDIIRSGGDDAAQVMAEAWPKIPAESVAGTISWLVSDEAAHVSGEEIGVWLGGPVRASAGKAFPGSSS